jgi:hypothetical protein
MTSEPKTKSQIGKSNVRRGKTYERRIANLLTDYTGKEFRRRRVEGRDLSVVERESTADVIPVNADVNFSIEVKAGKGFSFDALLANPKTNIFTTWWHKASYDAELLTKVLGRNIYPMLFFKYTITQDWIAVPQQAQLTLREGIVQCPCVKYDYIDNLVSMNVSHTSKRKNHVEVELSLHDVLFMRWKDFAGCIHPETLFLRG